MSKEVSKKIGNGFESKSSNSYRAFAWDLGFSFSSDKAGTIWSGVKEWFPNLFLKALLKFKCVICIRGGRGNDKICPTSQGQKHDGEKGNV